MDCELCQGLKGPPSRATKRRCIETTLLSLEASAAQGCALCLLFEQSVSPQLSEEKLRPGLSVECRIAEYYTGDVVISVYWGDRAVDDPQIIISLYLEPGTKRTDSTDVFPMRSHIVQDPSSNEAIELIRTWLEKCSAEHNHYPRPQITTKLPKRVIDVGLLDCSQQPKLVETNGTVGTYIALSHCWGKMQIITTKKNTIQERKQGIEWSSLSKTFQDAMSVTRQLRVPYIWIDSLCIVQDDPEDWETESAKMGGIYENAYLTIAATASSGGDQGFFKKRHPPHSIHFRGPNNETQEYLRIFAQAQPSHDGFTRRNHPDPRENPLLSRAWVYQERILSTRIVHFGSREMVWECKMAYECECGGIGRYMGPYSHPASFKQSYAEALDGTVPPASIWESMIREYTACALTYEQDRLPALAATARRLQSKLGTYYAGMWSSMLPASLFWMGNAYIFDNPGGPMVAEHKYWKPGTRSTAELCPPSWSWASLEHCVIDVWYDFAEIWIRVLEASVTPMLHDPYAIVSKAHLTLSGPLLPLNCSVAHSQGERYMHYVLERGHAVKECFPDVPIKEDGFADSDVEIYGLIGGLARHRTDSVHVLIVKRRDSERNIFERVGVIPYGPLKWYSCAKETTLILG